MEDVRNFNVTHVRRNDDRPSAFDLQLGAITNHYSIGTLIGLRICLI